jgi:hypothetical protein
MENTSIAFGSIFILLLVVAVCVAFAFWLWMLIHAIMNNGIRDNEKLLWVLVMIVFPLLGSAIYFFMGRPKNKAIKT